MCSFIAGIIAVFRVSVATSLTPVMLFEDMVTASGSTMTLRVVGSRLTYISSSSVAVHVPDIVLCPAADMDAPLSDDSDNEIEAFMFTLPSVLPVLVNVRTGMYDDGVEFPAISRSGAPDHEPCMSLDSLDADSQDVIIMPANDAAMTERK